MSAKAKCFTCLTLCALTYFFHEKFSYSIRAQEFELPKIERLPDPKTLRLSCLGYEELLGDFYWLSFIQYIGTENRRFNPTAYVDLITTIEPNFIPIYYFAAFIIGSELHQPKTAQIFIERGIAANPEDWRPLFIAGINAYLFAHNDLEASSYYSRASKFSGSPNWLARQAGILQAEIPSMIKEVNVWNSIYLSASDASVKQHARLRLATLWSKIFRTSPTEQIKRRALEQLHTIGFEYPVN